MDKLTPIQEAAVEIMNNNPVNPNHSFAEGRLADITAGFLAGSHLIGEEILKQLVEANPWTIHTDNWNRDRDIAWNKCVETLRSLINEQSTLTNKEGI